MNILKRILPLIALSGMLSGCAYLFPQNDVAEMMQPYSEPSFKEEPIQLKVNRIDITSEFTPSFTRPHVEHLFPISIEKTAKTWARDRLKAVDYSSHRVAEVIIKDASVTEEIEKNTQPQIFNKNRIIYHAHLNVIVRISDSESLTKAQTEVEAWRELIIPADTDIAEKEKYWNGMVTKLFDEFNAKMTQNINQYLNIYVINNNSVQTYR